MRRTQTSGAWLVWVDIILPVTFVLVLFGLLTRLLYLGSFDNRLASRAEYTLLDYTLRYAIDWDAQPESRIAAITVDEATRRGFPVKTTGVVTDLTIEQYARLLTAVWQANPRLVVLRWLPITHASNEYSPLVQALRSINQKDKILIGFPQTSFLTVPAELSLYATVLDDDTCSRVSQTCPYRETWGDWLPQVLLTQLQRMEDRSIPRFAVTESFSTPYPNFINNFSDPNLLYQISAAKILGDITELLRPTLEGRFVFIGQDIPQDYDDGYEDLMIKGAQTSFNLKDPERYHAYTPLHLFWAQLASMYLQDRFIQVPPPWVNLVLLLLICAIIIVAVIRLQSHLAFAIFTFMGLYVLALNYAALNLFGFYAPVFDILYFSFSAFVFSSFTKLSIDTMGAWQSELRREREQRTRVLRGNFVALISHNLNTAIAKIQGMLSILQPNLSEPAAVRGADNAIFELARFELLAKSLLVSASIDQNIDPSLNRLSLMALTEQFQQTNGHHLARLGLQLKGKIANAADEVRHLPLACNAPVIFSAFKALAVLAQNADFSFELKPTDAGYELGISVQLASQEPRFHLRQLASGLFDQRSALSDTGADFYTITLAQLLHKVIELYRGNLILQDHENLCRVNFSLSA